MSETDRLVHDAVWAVALALSSSSLPNTSREQFWRKFDNLSFEGASVRHVLILSTNARFDNVQL